MGLKCCVRGPSKDLNCLDTSATAIGLVMGPVRCR